MMLILMFTKLREAIIQDLVHFEKIIIIKNFNKNKMLRYDEILFRLKLTELKLQFNTIIFKIKLILLCIVAQLFNVKSQ